MSFDVWLENRTPFAAATHVQVDADGQEVLVVMLSASFEAAPGNGALAPAPEQTPVIFADVPWGDPALSSIRYEADIAPHKPAVDLIVNGTAYAPNGAAVRELQVGIQAADIRKVLVVTGDRLWHAGAYSDPHPFRSMPISFERAYGGTTPEGKTEPRNPVGIGFKGARSADPAVRSEAPNIHYPDRVFPADDPAPAGLGAIGRGWQPRLGYAGTYDQAWLDSQWPLPPHDFDPRHHLAAPPDQQSRVLAPGHTVTLVNLTPEGRWQFRLPRPTAPVRFIYDDRIEERAFRPDTILVEPDLRRVTLKARLIETTRRNAPKLREIAFGHVSPVWLNSRRKRKAYLNPLGGDGTLPNLPAWQP